MPAGRCVISAGARALFLGMPGGCRRLSFECLRWDGKPNRLGAGHDEVCLKLASHRQYLPVLGHSLRGVSIVLAAYSRLLRRPRIKWLSWKDYAGLVSWTERI